MALLLFAWATYLRTTLKANLLLAQIVAPRIPRNAITKSNQEYGTANGALETNILNTPESSL
jgi:hypothetical protein